MADSLEFINHYDILGLKIDATKLEITKAYRTKALICHPDKNKDDPKAVENFQKLLKSYLVLCDEKAKKALDAVLRAKLAVAQRNLRFDAKRKSLIDDLKRREKEHTESTATPYSSSYDNLMKNYEKEINRLRQESSRLVNEQEELIKNMMKTESKKPNNATTRIKVSWKCTCKNCIIDREILSKMFNKKNASVLEKGLNNHPLTVTLVSEESISKATTHPQVIKTDTSE
ncbi:hypothetical protein HZS_7463, partial [Henneguya salminicola]